MSGWALAVMLACSTADLSTTEIALARGGTERNPLMRQRSARVTFSVSVPIALWWGAKRKPEQIEKITWLYAAARCGGAAWNGHQLAKARP